MREKLNKLLNLLGKISVHLLLLASAILHLLVRLAGKAVIRSKPVLQRLKQKFLRLPRRQQAIAVACAILLVFACTEALLTEKTYSTVSECEDGACGFWAFHGKTGDGYWRNGVVSRLKVEHFNPYFVTIVSTRTAGFETGLTTRYEGKRRGRHIQGTYTSVWPGHGPIASGTWSADVDSVTAHQAWNLSQTSEMQGDIFEHTHWLMAGAAMGDSRAEDNLGCSYASGYGIALNYDKAYRLFSLAAAQGNKEAESNLGHMYATGLGVKKDPVQAAFWNKKSGITQNAVIQPASGGFFNTLNTIATQAGNETDAIFKARQQAVPQAAQEKLRDFVSNLVQKNMQMNAQRWAACQKSPECMEQVQNEKYSQEVQEEIQENDREFNINNPNYR